MGNDDLAGERQHSAARKADRLRDKLGWEPGILNGNGIKPKGMHWRTFERLKAEQKKTGMKDAIVTGEVFLRLIPLLAARGIVTLGQALEASRATYHSRLQY